MGTKELRLQRKLIAAALHDATDNQLRTALDGTIGDAQSFCWAALRQFDRKAAGSGFGSPHDRGLHYADGHLLLVASLEAVDHASLVERLLRAIGEPQELPPSTLVRIRLREARNLLAEHRDERVLYWRLTGRHTPHVIERYASLGVTLSGSIDSEVIGFSPYGIDDDEVIAAGRASVGTIGGLLSLPQLRQELLRLEKDLVVLAHRHQGR